VIAERLGWPEERTEAKSLTDALRCGGTLLTEDADVLIARDGVDVIVEATGNPAAGIQHALACFGHKRHIVMVNVEADVLAGPMLARRAAEADVLYSMAYGDQPALNAQMFNSFLDGTKSAIEMAAVANATDLDIADDGLAFPPCGRRRPSSAATP
jgi:predicted homoserine dehydrogenase-like protein